MHDNFCAGFHFGLVSPEPLFHAGQAVLCPVECELCFVDGQSSGLDGLRHVGQPGGQKFLLRLGHLFGSLVNQFLPIKLTVGFKPDPGPDHVLADFVQEAASFLQIDDQAGFEGLEGLDRRDLGGLRHDQCWDKYSSMR